MIADVMIMDSHLPDGDVPIPSIPIAYARSEAPASARVWAAFAVMFGGLGLLVVGGCFLIGVLLHIHHGFQATMPGQFTATFDFFLILLYVLAFASFAGGIWVLLLGIRGLLSVIRG